MFSPAYFAARARRLTVAPEAHCALNVALYGSRTRWALTEHARVARGPLSFALGDSTLAWEGDELVIDLAERTPAFARPIRGRVRVRPGALHEHAFALDPDARHCWWCLAPMATAEVDLVDPQVRFRGAAYLDANFGREPLELGLRRWDWCRARGREDAVVLYDTWPRRGEPVERALRFDERGRCEQVDVRHRSDLPATRWRMPRAIRSDDPGSLQQLRVLEDAPFYARALVRATLAGSPRVAVHESVCLDRFRNPLVQLMLSFRIRGRWRA